MDKIVIIINGMGGSGKDTLCDLAAEYYKTRNISSITPIKQIAYENGWNGEKDARSRKFLSELKRVFIEYNNLPTTYLYHEYLDFLKSDEEILFVHIREKEEIDSFRKIVEIRCVTLLIVGQFSDSKQIWGNSSDDDVEDYPYDFVFYNNRGLNEIGPVFASFLEQIYRSDYTGSTSAYTSRRQPGFST